MKSPLDQGQTELKKGKELVEQNMRALWELRRLKHDSFA